MRSPLRSPAQVEGPQGVLPQPEKDLENNVEHIALCLLAIYMSSLVRCLFSLLPIQFLAKLFVFLFLNFKSSLCILYSSSLAECCLYIFSPNL